MSQSRHYDHPTYEVPVTYNCLATGSASSVAGRFAAYADMQAMQAVVTVVTAGTAAGNNVLIEKVVNGTATTMSATPTIGTNAAGYTAAVSLGGQDINKGDLIRVTKGADATAVMAVAVEARVKPRAQYTDNTNIGAAGSAF